MSLTRRRLLGTLGGVGLMGSGVFGYSAHSASHDPAVKTIKNPETGRLIQLRVRLPEQNTQTGLILYSPSLGSGVTNGTAWCEAWRQAGFVVVTLAHSLTDDSIWQTSAKQSFKENMDRALDGSQYGLRVTDCTFALDNCLQSSMLKPYIDPAKIGFAGHSYGALTAQVIAGQPLGATDRRDSRIKAVIALSPGATTVARAQSMSNVTIPFLCVTGDHDEFVTFKKDSQAIQLGVHLANREAIFASLPQGKKLQYKLHHADHMSFAGETVDEKRFSRSIQVTEQEDRVTWNRVCSVSTKFWEFYLAANSNKTVAEKAAFQAACLELIGPGDTLMFG